MTRNSVERGCLSAVLSGLILLAAATVVGCGGGGGGGGVGSASGTVTTHLSDPAPCKNTYLHAWVTVDDIRAHISPSASSGFTDLTPKLRDNPVQVDLLSETATECFLATVGDTSGLPPGKYQQIRVILLDNAAPAAGVNPPSPNQCASLGADVFNCIQLASDSSFHELSLPSEAKTGIKIPPGQIAHGGLKIASGQSVDIDVDFNACTSVVEAGKGGRFDLKPTLRAAEVGTSPLIQGNVVEGTVSGGTVTAGATAVTNASVWLEEQSRTASVQGGGDDTVENLIQITQSDSSGHFEFCPIAAGSYEVVADSPLLPTSGDPSNATITEGVSVSSSGGPASFVMPLVAESSATAATIAGEVTTTSATPPGAGDDVAMAALQSFTSGGATIQAQIPFFPAGTIPAPPMVQTTSDGTGTGGPNCTSTCPANTNCACYQLLVPASNPVTGSPSSDGSGYTQSTGATVDYSVDAAATIVGGVTAECSPSELALPSFAVTGGATTTAASINFSSCN